MKKILFIFIAVLFFAYPNSVNAEREYDLPESLSYFVDDYLLEYSEITTPEKLILDIAEENVSEQYTLHFLKSYDGKLGFVVVEIKDPLFDLAVLAYEGYKSQLEIWDITTDTWNMITNNLSKYSGELKPGEVLPENYFLIASVPETEQKFMFMSYNGSTYYDVPNDIDNIDLVGRKLQEIMPAKRP